MRNERMRTQIPYFIPHTANLIFYTLYPIPKMLKKTMKKTKILKLTEHDEQLEIEFELEFLNSLSVQERFQLLEEKINL